jgi:hypothetical protein
MVVQSATRVAYAYKNVLEVIGNALCGYKLEFQW